jgi:superfamily II DNA or RNA helicase
MAMAMNANGFAELKIKKVNGEWELDVAPEDMAKPKYVSFTGNTEETQILLRIFNSDPENVPPKIRVALGGSFNLRGELIKVLMITKSGAEGISLKNVRQVHVLEPYWNHIRIDQVIGRAVRTCSHVDLPKEDRNVKVYVYTMGFTKDQLDKSFTLKTVDDGMTSDEYLYKLAKKKAKIINNLLEVMKKASIDCALNAKTHGNLRCFSLPVNIKDDVLLYHLDIQQDTLDEQYAREITKNEWKGEVLITKKGNFLIRPETNEVYDYDIYIESGKLVKIGVLKVVNNQRKEIHKT